MGTDMQDIQFQSTPSARRATRSGQQLLNAFVISIHALREEGDAGTAVQGLPFLISIHALREEGDLQLVAVLQGRDISIHALREEGDERGERIPRDQIKFQSTPSARRATCQAFRAGY